MSNRLPVKKGTDDAWKNKDASPLSLLVDAAETQNLRTPQVGGTGNRLPSSNSLPRRGSVGTNSPIPPPTLSGNGNEYSNGNGNGNPSSLSQGGPGSRSQQPASGRNLEGGGSSQLQNNTHSGSEQHSLMQRQAMSAALEASQMQQHGHFNGLMGRSGLSETERNMYHHALAAAQQQQQAQQHAAALSILRQASMQGGGGHQFGQFDDGLLVRAAAIAAQQQRGFGGLGGAGAGGGGGNNSSLVAAVIANNPHLGPHLQQEIDQIIRQQQEEELQRRQQLQQLHQRAAGGGGDGGYPQQLQAARQLQLQQEAQLLREKDMMVHEAEQRERDLIQRVQGRAGSLALGGVGSPICRPVNGEIPSSVTSAMGNNARPSSSGGAHLNESFKKVPGSVLVPCRARGMPMDHNFKTAYFVIPEEVEHGEELICSYYSCRNVGIKFRYCVHCKVPVAKRNFRKRHKHGMANETDDEANEEDSDEGEFVDVVTSPQAIPQHAASLGDTSSSNLPESSMEDKPPAKASAARPSLVGTSTVGKVHASTKTTASASTPKTSISTFNCRSISSSEKKLLRYKEKVAVSSPENGKKNGCNKIDDVRVERWASLLVNRPPTSASSAMSNWLLEVLAVSDLDKPLKDIPSMSADAKNVSPTVSTGLTESSNQTNVTPVPPEDDDDSEASDEEYDDSELDDQRPPVKSSPASAMPSFASLKKYKKRALPLGGASGAGRLAAAAAEKNEPSQEKKKHKKMRKEKIIERK